MSVNSIRRFATGKRCRPPASARSAWRLTHRVQLPPAGGVFVGIVLTFEQRYLNIIDDRCRWSVLLAENTPAVRRHRANHGLRLIQGHVNREWGTCSRAVLDERDTHVLFAFLRSRSS